MNLRSPFLLEHTAEVTDLQWFIVRTLGFLVMVFIVWKFIVPVIRGMLRDRYDSIISAEAQRQATLTETEAVRDDYRNRLNRIEAETSDRLDQAVVEADELKTHILGEAARASAALLARAEAEVKMERAKALADLRSEFAEGVVGAAAEAASLSLTETRQEALLSRFVAQLGGGS